MHTLIKTGFITAGLIAGTLTMSGCVGPLTAVPSNQPYSFVKESPEYREYYWQVYSPANMGSLRSSAKDNQVDVQITKPVGRQVVFFNNRFKVDTANNEKNTVKFRAGVYPFEVKKAGLTELTGAMMFYNIDKTLSLVTLGLGNKAIFNPELVAQARQGQLGKYTMKFDEKNILTYWVGNRTKLFPGGARPTVEVDFSGTQGITELKIGKRVVSGFAKPVYISKPVCDSRGYVVQVPVEYPIELSVKGKQYRGYLQKLKSNEYTTFVKIPCSIPEKLLQAADKGTVSKFQVFCGEGDQKDNVAEIVISRK